MWVSVGFILFAMLTCYFIISIDRVMKEKGKPIGDAEHWKVKIHGSGNHEHTVEHLGSHSFQRFCIEDNDPFYEGMHVDLYFQRYEKCWKILYYTIDRSDNNGTLAAN